MKASIFGLFVLLFLVPFSFSGFVFAQSESDKTLENTTEDDSFSGFGDEGGFMDIDVKVDDIQEIAAPIEESFFSFGGFIKEELGYSHVKDDPDFSRIRTTLNLNADVKFSDKWKIKANWNGFYDYAYEHQGRDKFTDETLEANESESEIRDFYLDGAVTNWLQIRLGRQIIAWGESEISQINDMANPRDMKELGMVDLEDARIPVAASKISGVFGSFGVDLVAIHEIRTNKLAPAGSEFDTLAALRENEMIQLEDEEIPKSNTGNTEYLVRISNSFNGGDARLFWADVYDDSPYLDFYELAIIQGKPLVTLIPRHKRIKSYGFAANAVTGSWLFKTEGARKIGVAVPRNDMDKQLETLMTAYMASMPFPPVIPPPTVVYDEDSKKLKTWSSKDILQGMVGMEYSGITDLTLTFEVSGERIEDYDENLASKETSGLAALTISYEALRQTLKTRFMWVRFTDDNGDVYRLNVDYDIIDALRISAGIVAYEASDEEAMLYAFRKNDRVFTSLKYSF